MQCLDMLFKKWHKWDVTTGKLQMVIFVTVEIEKLYNSQPHIVAMYIETISLHCCTI